MLTEPSNEQEAVAVQVHRMADQLEAMGARISLLARGLKLSLQTPSEIQAVLRCDEACARGLNTRENRMMEELRGLLVLRYDVIAQLAGNQQVGAPAARDLLLYANDRLQAKGFDAGDPGINLRPLFDGLDN